MFYFSSEIKGKSSPRCFHYQGNAWRKWFPHWWHCRVFCIKEFCWATVWFVWRFQIVCSGCLIVWVCVCVCPAMGLHPCLFSFHAARQQNVIILKVGDSFQCLELWQALQRMVNLAVYASFDSILEINNQRCWFITSKRMYQKTNRGYEKLYEIASSYVPSDEYTPIFWTFA